MSQGRADPRRGLADCLQVSPEPRWPHTVSGIRADHELVEDRGETVQLNEMGWGELAQAALSPGGKPDPDAPSVAGVGDTPYEAGGRRAVHKLYRAVMPQQQVAREIPDGRRLVTGMALDRDQELVLDMSQPGRASLILAPALEAAQAAAEREQVLEILTGHLRHTTCSAQALAASDRP